MNDTSGRGSQTIDLWDVNGSSNICPLCLQHTHTSIFQIMQSDPLSFPIPSLPEPRPADGEEIEQRVPEHISRLQRLIEGQSEIVAWFTRRGQLGIPLHRVRDGGVEDMDDADSRAIFAAFTGPKVQYRVFWMGYEPFSRQKYVRRKRTGDITRNEIVLQVADVIGEFIKKHSSFTINPEYQKWRVGDGAIELKNLELIALKRVLNAGVQPVFRYRCA